MIKEETASIQRRSLRATNSGRVSVRTRKMYHSIRDDRVNQYQIAGGEPQQEDAMDRVENDLDDTNGAIDKTSILVKVPR